MKPKIIVTRDIPDEVEVKLKEYFQVSFNREDKVYTKDILRKAMQNADGIVCTVTDNITNDLLSTKNKKVKIIANIGVASGSATVGTVGKTVGSFFGADGKISEDVMRIQDSNFYQLRNK